MVKRRNESNGPLKKLEIIQLSLPSYVLLKSEGSNHL